MGSHLLTLSNMVFLGPVFTFDLLIISVPVFWHRLCFFVPAGITQQFRFCGVMQNRRDFFESRGVHFFFFDGQVICILPCDRTRQEQMFSWVPWA